MRLHAVSKLSDPKTPLQARVTSLRRNTPPLSTSLGSSLATFPCRLLSCAVASGWPPAVRHFHPWANTSKCHPNKACSVSLPSCSHIVFFDQLPISWNSLQNGDFQALFQSSWIKNSWAGPSNLYFNKPFGWLCFMLKFGNHCLKFYKKWPPWWGLQFSSICAKTS